MLRNRLTFANIVSVLALVIAVAGTGGGVAYAHGKIGSGDLKKNAVKSKHVKNNNLRSKDIKNGNLKSKDIKNNNLRGADIKNGSLGTHELRPKATGLAITGITTDFRGDIQGWFNRAGRKPSVNHLGTGKYQVTIPGLTITNTSIVQVTPKSAAGRLCTWQIRPDQTVDVLVTCGDPAGPLRNTPFSLTVLAE